MKPMTIIITIKIDPDIPDGSYPISARAITPTSNCMLKGSSLRNVLKDIGRMIEPDITGGNQ